MIDQEICDAIDATWHVSPRFEPQVASLFIVLWRARGRTVTHGFIREAVWNMRAEEPTDAGIRTACKKLRETIRAAGWPIEVSTVRGLGWRLDAPRDWDWRVKGDGDGA